MVSLIHLPFKKKEVLIHEDTPRFTLAKKARAVVGIDYSPTAIEYAKHRYSASNLEFKTIDACSKEIVSILGSNRFDLIVSFDVIEHIEKYFHLEPENKILENAFGLMAVCRQPGLHIPPHIIQ